MPLRLNPGWFLIAACISGCASQSVNDRISTAENIAHRAGFERIDIQAERFKLMAFFRLKNAPTILRIYIEGDGFAWATRNRPSINPTPTDPVALKLAAIDKYGAAYLARPCQYFEIRDSGCEARYWTNARFSSEIIDSMNEAVNQLKQKAKVEKLVLIGYSGGGTVAALIAARRKDVIQLATVAGNLDHKAWTRYHSISELKKSLNPPDYWREIGNISQIHFVGMNDSIVPLDVYQSYRNAFFASDKIQAKVIPDNDHNCCWEHVWPSLLEDLN